MNKKIEYIVVVSMVLVGTYLVYHQIVNAQQQGDIVDQGDVRQLLELGEQNIEKNVKDISDNVIFDDIMNDILDYMPDSIREDMCEKKISEIKNQTLGSILEK